MKRLLRKRLKGSYTVEAAFIVPIYLFMMAAVIKTGIDMYQELQKTEEETYLEGVYVTDDFYNLQSVGKTLEEVKKWAGR